jgi:D-glycero-alpha-D-manno-heptose-7-phosphate kinase
LKKIEMTDAALAHWIESELLEQQTGVQDQIIASLGGIQFIQIDHYPDAKSETVFISPTFQKALETQIRTIYLGLPHHSSAIHEMVIDKMEKDEAFNERYLEALRRCAIEGRKALMVEDLDWFGRILTENTAIQEEMHGELVSDGAKELIREFGDLCLGWKVNGAGGDGGTVSFLVKETFLNDFDIRFSMLKDTRQNLQLFRHRISSIQ